MMEAAMARWTRLMVRRRGWVILTVVVLSALLASGAQRLRFTNDYRVFFSEDNPQLAAFEAMQDTYSKNDNVLFLLLPRSGEVFTPEVLRAIAELTEAAWQIPYARRVDSVTNFQHTRAEGDDLVVEDLVAEPDTLDAREAARIRAIALAEPQLVHRLLAPDGHAAGVNVTIELPGADPVREVPEVMAAARALVERFAARHPDIEIRMTGIIPLDHAFSEAAQQDLRTLVPLAFAAIVAGLWLFLRSAGATLATVAVILLSIAAAMGSAGWMGIDLTPPLASAPTMILTLAVADSIHFLTTAQLALGRGMTREEALVESMRVNFHPILLTSLTTAVGFASMNFSDAPPFRDLGNVTALGVLFALALTVTLLPALAAVLPLRPRAPDTRAPRAMSRLADWVIRRHRTLRATFSVLVPVLVALIPLNELDDNYIEYFDRDVPFRQDTDRVLEHLTGVYMIDYSLDSGESGGIADPAFLRTVDRFANWLRAQPEVVHVSTITDTFRRLNRNLHGDDPEWYRLPEARDAAAQYLLLYEMSLPYGLDLNNRIDVDKAATRVSASLVTLTTSDTLAFERRARAWLERNAPELAGEGTSPLLMFSHIGKRNIDSMLSGTLVALLLISVILVFALGSLRMGLLSLVPNLAPAGMAFGLWALIDGRVGLALSVVVAMTLGIVVDDTIHFLSKYLRARREQGLNAEAAIRHAFSQVGTALWVTTVVLVAGFLVLSASSFEINSSMGLLTAITIALALVVDFLFLPALLMQFDRRKHHEGEIA